MDKFNNDLTGATRLRTLTRKSVLNFGKYKELTVQQVLDLSHTRYLRWCYYCNSGISFTDEILADIGVLYFNGKYSHDRRIVKPGKDEDANKTLNTIMNLAGSDLQRLKQWSRRKKVKKLDSKRKLKTFKYLSKRGNLMAKNHGH